MVKYELALNPKIIPLNVSNPVHHINQVLPRPVSHWAQLALWPPCSWTRCNAQERWIHHCFIATGPHLSNWTPLFCLYSGPCHYLSYCTICLHSVTFSLNAIAVGIPFCQEVAHTVHNEWVLWHKSALCTFYVKRALVLTSKRVALSLFSLAMQNYFISLKSQVAPSKSRQ